MEAAERGQRSPSFLPQGGALQHPAPPGKHQLLLPVALVSPASRSEPAWVTDTKRPVLWLPSQVTADFGDG